MARREARPPAEREVRLTRRLIHCLSCGQRLWVAYHARRTLMTFRGLVRLLPLHRLLALLQQAQLSLQGVK